MNITAIKRPATDLSNRLRELADLADSGKLTDFVCAYVVDNGYDFVYGASLHSCIVMASMLWQSCVDRIRR